MNSRVRSTLFDAAVQHALESRLIRARSEASLDASHRSDGSYVLMSADGALIERLPLAVVSKLARTRERRFEVLADVEVLKRLPLQARREHFGVLSRRRRALAWAIAVGEPIPRGRMGPGAWGLTVVLLLLGLVPGLVYLAWALPRDGRYRRALAALERRWVAAGKPEPPDPAFQFLLRS
jgi:hypothetical protein